MKKRTIALIAVLALILSVFTACSSDTAPSSAPDASQESASPAAASDAQSPAATGDKIIIGYSTCDMTVPFVIANNIGIYEACKDLNVELLVADSKNDVGTQLADIENMIQQGAQAIILTASDTNSADAYWDLTKAAGIPLISMNRSLGKKGEGFVGSDSRQAAADMTQMIIEAMGESGNIGHLEGLLGDTTNNDRTGAVLATIEKYSGVQRTRNESCDWERVKAIEKVETWIQAGDSFSGIIANSDEMAIGASIALEGAGMLDSVAVGGIGGEPTALEMVRDGKMLVTMSSSTFDMGYQSVVMAVRHVKGENDGFESHDIPFTAVTIDNVAEYMAEQERIDALGY